MSSAAAAAPLRLAVSSSSPNRALKPVILSSSSTTHSESSEKEESKRLSSDLALFLSDPKLKRDLEDGSLDLASYSHRMDQELLALERDCIQVYQEQEARILQEEYKENSLEKEEQVCALDHVKSEMELCESMLSSLEEMLLGFQADLGGLGKEMRTLQEQSKAISIQLRNRKWAETELRQFLQLVILPPGMVDVLCGPRITTMTEGSMTMTSANTAAAMHPGGDTTTATSHASISTVDLLNHQDAFIKRGLVVIDSTFMKCVLELERKYQYLTKALALWKREMDFSTPAPAPTTSSSSSSSSHAEQEDRMKKEHAFMMSAAQSKAGKEMLQHITKVRTMVVHTIRAYFLTTIQQLRRLKTNVRMMQVNALLKYSPLLDLLKTVAMEESSSVATATTMASTSNTTLPTDADTMGEDDEEEKEPEAIVTTSTTTPTNASLNTSAHASSPKRNMMYQEILSVYTDSMSTILHALFRSYAAQLALMDKRKVSPHTVVSRKDVIAVEDRVLKSMATSSVASAAYSSSTKTEVFYLGDRIAVLEDDRLNQVSSGSSSLQQQQHQHRTATSSMPYQPIVTPILAHVSVAEGMQYNYEVIFKSILMHLMDAATNEYVFVRQFFKEDGPKAFPVIFSRTLSLLLEQLENYLFDCYDILAILLMIKVTHVNKRIMRLRKIKAMDKFFDSILALLWPRLKALMDMQIKSVRDADAKKLGVGERDALHAHYVCRRYAEFTCSIWMILNYGTPAAAAAAAAANEKEKDGSLSKHAESLSLNSPTAVPPSSTIVEKSEFRGSTGDMLVNDLRVLTEAMIQLLERLADSLPTNKKKIVFWINNLDQIINSFNERRVTGYEHNRLVELFTLERELFVEEELLQGFSKMIAFVQQTEQFFVRDNHPTERGGASKGAVEEQKVEVNIHVVEGLVQEFATHWKKHMEQINRNVLSYFSDFRTGMEILKQVLTQLLLYYTRFQDIIRKVWRSKPPAFCKDLVSTTIILTEIKKYSLAI